MAGMVVNDAGQFMVTFIVPGQPQGKGRARATVRGGVPVMYTPQKTVSYEKQVNAEAKAAMGSMAPLSGPCAVGMYIDVAVPASWSKKRQHEALYGDKEPVSKPDIDNVVKALFDGMNGAVWRDDVQVSHLTVVRRYSKTPGVRVTVSSRLEAA